MSDKKSRVDPITRDDKRLNIPTKNRSIDKYWPINASYEMHNPDLDPQLIWRGKNIKQTQ